MPLSILRSLNVQVCKGGMTRRVFLIGPYAIKIPWASEWRLFLLGMVGNLSEDRWRVRGHPGLSKVHFTSRTGLFAIHERLKPVNHTGLFTLDLERLCVMHPDLPRRFWLSDSKPNNFGYRGNDLVKLDFASFSS